MSKIYLEILDKERQNVFHKLQPFAKNGYLGGGTALALQINHRKSFDFDIFIGKQVSNQLRLKIKEIFGEVQFSLNTKDQVNFLTNTISVTFLWYYFDRLFPVIPTSFLPLASLSDIAADKAHTLGRRVSWRDYVDIYFLLRHFSLKEIIELAKRKFKGEFEELFFLQQLTYFEGLEIVPIEYVGKAPGEGEIKKILEEAVSEYIQSKKVA